MFPSSDSNVNKIVDRHFTSDGTESSRKRKCARFKNREMFSLRVTADGAFNDRGENVYGELNARRSSMLAF